jgi:hypothetical protein
MSFLLPAFAGLSTAKTSMHAYQAQVARNYQLIAERNLAGDLAAAKALRESALAHGTLDEVARIICPTVKRKPGRQWGSRSEVLADRSDTLWRAYQDERVKSLSATEAEIAQSLFAKGGRKYGNSPTAVAAHVAKIKAKMNAPSLLARAGRPRKLGRPKKKTANPI